MDFSVEKKISNFVESQFPQFYLEEGPNFVLFVKAYYEWLESSYAVNKTDKTDILSKEQYYTLTVPQRSQYDLQLNAIHQARNLFDYRDIDNTLEDFLEHFQQKYLYGIPFNVIITKRYLLKHILDVYRSKGSIQCYKLLFKLIYDHDVDVYLPGRDLLKPSDGTWTQPLYIEVISGGDLSGFVGKPIVGTSSGTTAVVESYITEPVNQNIISTLFISNLSPKGGQFNIGEKLLLQTQINSGATIAAAPTVIGSLDNLQIVNGGQNFSVGDIIKIVHKDDNNNIISNGINGKLRVTATERQQGVVRFDIADGGYGYAPDSNIFIYKGDGDVTGAGASFTIGSFSYTREIPYNTDIIVDYRNTLFNATTYGFPGAPTANSASVISSFTSQTQKTFGRIAVLTNVNTGYNYQNDLDIFVRSTQTARNSLPGAITYSTSSNSVVGTGTVFQGNSTTTFFSAGDVIYLKANSTNSSTIEYQVIKSVESNTHLTLYNPPKNNSTVSASYKNAPVTLPSNYTDEESGVYAPSTQHNVGENEIIRGYPSIGGGIITATTAVDSGKGYLDQESVYAYLFNGLTPVTIVDGGLHYANNEQLIFAGGDTSTPASGYITTDSSGTIVSVILTSGGSNYNSTPTVTVRTKTGTGANLVTSVTQFNTSSVVTGRVAKKGIGKQQGYWSTTRGFLNSDKRIQDSKFYQDYSYQIKTALTLDKYKDILYNTFHTAGSALFGQFYQQIEENSSSAVLYDSKEVIYYTEQVITTDSTSVTSDSTRITADVSVG